MSGQVLQGFFIGGAIRPQPAPNAAAAEARPRHPTRTPPPAFAGQAAPLQARMAPGRPPLAHQGAGRIAQAHGGNGSFEIDPVQLGLARGGGKPLPEAVLAKMEAAFGADFSAVRVHVGPQASRIGAIAFTTGNDLYFAPGQFQPDSLQGQQLIGHELAHVVQQRQGRVRAQGSGIAVVQDRALEAEADRLGMRAASLSAPRGPAAQRRDALTQIMRSLREPVQRSVDKNRAPPKTGPGTVVQRFTAITYIPAHNRPATDVVFDVRHQRVMHNNTQRMLASYLSGYDSPLDATNDGCMTCNHYVPYNSIAAAVLAQVRAQPNLGASVAWLMGLNANLPGAQNYTAAAIGRVGNWNFNVGAVPPVAIAPTGALGGVNQYSEATLNNQIDDLIFNLANDPRNMFYWRASSGDAGGAQVDNPQGNNGPIPLNNLRGRLQNYRNHLINNLGIPVV